MYLFLFCLHWTVTGLCYCSRLMDESLIWYSIAAACFSVRPALAVFGLCTLFHTRVVYVFSFNRRVPQRLSHTSVSAWGSDREAVAMKALRHEPFSSVQDGIYALGKAHMCSTLSLRNFPSVAGETVPMFVWLTMALSRPFKEGSLALPLSTPLSSWRLVVLCINHFGFVIWQSQGPPSLCVSAVWLKRTIRTSCCRPVRLKRTECHTMRPKPTS